MKRNGFSLLAVALCTLFLLHGQTAFGRSSGSAGSGSHSSSSRSSSSSSSKSYSNSSGSRKSSSGSQGTSSKYGNSSGSPSRESRSSAPGKYTNTAGKSAQSSSPSGGSSPFGHAGDKGFAKENAKESLHSYNAERAKFRTPENAGAGGSTGSSNSGVLGRTTYNPDTYIERRGTFYRNSGYTQPGYIYRSYPRFGVWDAMFMWFMLDNITRPHYSQMYYHHQNDPGFQQWRKEAEKMSGENQELKQKLATLDQEVARLKGQPVDPSYAPPGVDTDLLMDKGALDELKGGKPKKTGFGFWKLLFGLLLLSAVAYGLWKLLRGRGKTPPQKFKLD